MSTAPQAVLNVATLNNLLELGDTTVQTANGAENINIRHGFGWAGARLTLIAERNVVVKAPIFVAWDGLTITPNDGGTGGDLLFSSDGRIEFWHPAMSDLVIGGKSYTLVADIKTLAADIAQAPTGFYALASNYDAAIDGAYRSAPIPNTFLGTFEGLGHKISNLTIIGHGKSIGLFAAIGAHPSTVRDVQLKALTIAVKRGGEFVGGLAGKNDGTITHAFAKGRIEGSTDYKHYAGGLVGFNGHSGELADCGAGVAVSGSVVGGLVGMSTGSIYNSRAAGRVHGTYLAGGLAGFARLVGTSYATGDVSVIGGNGGGLEGAGNDVYNAYATGAVEGDDASAVGGAIGDKELGAQGVVATTYALGSIARAGTRGGFIGKSTQGSEYVFNDDYWDMDTSNMRQGCGKGQGCAGIFGLADAQMKSGLPTGFDPAIWGQSPKINHGYPYLLANPPPK
jgi:hypothetical protein